MKLLTIRGYIAVLAMVMLVTAGVFMAGSAKAQDDGVHHALGTFRVSVTPADPEATEAGLGLSRYAIAKTFEGGIVGSGTGQMLAGANAPVRVYVALERVVGTLDGREGAFLLAHRGDMDASGQSLAITVVPGSGTGDLTGISGEFGLTIADGVHHYDLAYRLPTQ